MSDAQTLKVPFQLPDGRGGVVTADVAPQHDPQRYGIDILFPGYYPQSDFARGFPTCKATVHSKMEGYASSYGWVQLVKDSPDGWQKDPVPIFKDLNTPFTFFGAEPTLFDAPLRFGEYFRPLEWFARSFLTYVPDTCLTKEMVPILGFEWGFDIADDLKVQVKPLRKLDRQWDDHLDFLRDTFPGWEFSSCAGQTAL